MTPTTSTTVTEMDVSAAFDAYIAASIAARRLASVSPSAAALAADAAEAAFGAYIAAKAAIRAARV